MNSNLKKLFGFATIAACTFGFAMNVNAASTASVDDDGVCTATTMDMDSLKDCASGKVNDKEVKSISITGDFEITDSITIKYDITSTGKITVASNKTLTLTDAKLEAASLEVAYKGSVKTNSTIDANVDIKAEGSLTSSVVTKDGNALSAIEGNVVVRKGATLNVSADNTNTKLPNAENSAKAIEGTLELTEATATISKGTVSGAVTLNEKSNLTATELDAVTVAADAKDVKVKADKITGLVTANENATVEAKEISGGATVNENATVKADKITGTITVNGEGATIQYVEGTTRPVPTKGIARWSTKDSNGKPYVEVIAVGVKSVSLAANEKLVVEDLDEVADEITAANGATIENKTGNDKIVLTVNGKSVEIEKGEDKALVVSNGTDTPVDPTDPTNPDKPNTGDDQPNKNPQTFDGILSYVGVALSSVGGLGVSLKKRLFR